MFLQKIGKSCFKTSKYIFKISCQANNSMPKKKTTALTNPKSVKPCVAVKSVSTSSSGDVLINILAKPGAKQNSITDISENQVGVQIAAPPVDGEANKELIKYLSKVLSLRKSDLSLEKGSRSRDKRVSVSKTVATEEQIMNKLRIEMENG